MGMSKLHSRVRKCHSQDFVHSPSVIVSHCKNISKCVIFSRVICLSLKPSQFVSHLPFISWATLPTIATLGTVQQQRLLTLPALTWSGPAPKESSRKPDQVLFQHNCNRYLREKAVNKKLPKPLWAGHSSSVVLAAHTQYLFAQHTRKVFCCKDVSDGFVLLLAEVWQMMTAMQRQKHLYSSVSAPCFKIQQC